MLKYLALLGLMILKLAVLRLLSFNSQHMPGLVMRLALRVGSRLSRRRGAKRINNDLTNTKTRYAMTR